MNEHVPLPSMHYCSDDSLAVPKQPQPPAPSSSSSASFYNSNMYMKPGCRGDPRMNKAVAAKLKDPELSLYEALRVGGFHYPANVDAATVDNDRVTLGQRKNQLNRRLRMARKTTGSGSSNSSTTSTSSNKNNENFSNKEDKSINAAGALAIAGSYVRQQQQKTRKQQQQQQTATAKPKRANSNGSHNKRAAAATKNDSMAAKKQCLLRESHHDAHETTNLFGAMFQTLTAEPQQQQQQPQQVRVGGGIVSPTNCDPTTASSSSTSCTTSMMIGTSLSLPLSLTLPLDMTGSSARLLQTSSSASNAACTEWPNLTIENANAEEQRDDGVQGEEEEPSIDALAASLDFWKDQLHVNSNNISLLSSSNSNHHDNFHNNSNNNNWALGQSQPQQQPQVQQQRPQVVLQTPTIQQPPQLQPNEELGLQFFQAGLQDLYQKSMLAAGYNIAEVSNEASQSYRSFAFRAWKTECERLQNVLKD